MAPRVPVQDDNERVHVMVTISPGGHGPMLRVLFTNVTHFPQTEQQLPKQRGLITLFSPTLTLLGSQAPRFSCVAKLGVSGI